MLNKIMMLISSIEANDMIGSDDVRDYLKDLSILFDNELSYKYYTDSGYYIGKYLSPLDNYPFTHWELIFVNYYLKQFEYIFRLFNFKVEDISFSEGFIEVY